MMVLVLAAAVTAALPGAPEKDAGKAAFERRDWTAAATSWKACWDIRVRALGPDHRETLRCHNNYGLAVADGGDTTEGLRLFPEVVERTTRALGPNHPDALMYLDNLTLTLVDREEWARAEAPQRTLVAGYEAKKPNSPELAGAYATLAKILWSQDRKIEAIAPKRAGWALFRVMEGETAERTLKEAEELYRLMSLANRRYATLDVLQPAYDALKAARGIDDERTDDFAYMLASALGDTGRPREAEALHRQVMDRAIRRNGETGDVALNAAQALAGDLADQGRFIEAVTILRRVRAARIAEGGPDSSKAVDATVNLAAALEHNGDWQEAETLARDALERRLRVLGPDHPNTLGSRHNLANLMLSRGAWTEAEAALRQVLADRRRVLGADHPATLETQWNLALLLNELGRRAESVGLQRQVLAARQRVLGPTHLETLRSSVTLARIYLNSRRLAEAQQQLDETIPLVRLHLGDRSPVMLNALEIESHLKHQRGEFAAAVEAQRALVTLAEQLYGPDHEVVLLNRYDLASKIYDADQSREALTILADVWQRRAARFGQNEPETLNVGNALGVMLIRFDRVQDAEAVFAEIAEAYDRRIVAQPAEAQRPGVIKAFANLGDVRTVLGRPEQGYGWAERAARAVMKRSRDRRTAGDAAQAREVLTDERRVFLAQVRAGWAWAQQQDGGGQPPP